jgi:hypothetical protein
MRFPFLLALCAALPLSAAPRVWKSADGDRTVRAEFVRRDAETITLKRSDNREVTIELDKLHADDRRWLELNHPVARPVEAPPNAVFDHLVFGDTRAQVLDKLRKSKAVEMIVDERFIARFGLNGIFRTTEKIGGQPALLFFDWSDEGTLTEVSLQTEVRPAHQYEAGLKPFWEAMRDLLTNLNGPPRVKGTAPALERIEINSMLATHVWDLKPEGCLLLGTARQDDGYLVVARFSRERH